MEKDNKTQTMPFILDLNGSKRTISFNGTRVAQVVVQTNPHKGSKSDSWMLKFSKKNYFEIVERNLENHDLFRQLILELFKKTDWDKIYHETPVSLYC